MPVRAVRLPSSDPCITLAGRLAVAASAPAPTSTPPPRLGLLLLHAYPRLGGSSGDPVITAAFHAARARHGPKKGSLLFSVILRYDQRGVGASGGAKALWGGPDAADAAALAGRMLGRGGGLPGVPACDRVYICGYSWGGALGAVGAAGLPGVAGWVGVSPPLGGAAGLALRTGRAAAALGAAPTTPGLVILGDRDQFCSVRSAIRAAAAVNAERQRRAGVGVGVGVGVGAGGGRPPPPRPRPRSTWLSSTVPTTSGAAPPPAARPGATSRAACWTGWRAQRGRGSAGQEACTEREEGERRREGRGDRIFTLSPHAPPSCGSCLPLLSPGGPLRARSTSSTRPRQSLPSRPAMAASTASSSPRVTCANPVARPSERVPRRTSVQGPNGSRRDCRSPAVALKSRPATKMWRPVVGGVGRTRRVSCGRAGSAGARGGGGPRGPLGGAPPRPPRSPRSPPPRSPPPRSPPPRSPPPRSPPPRSPPPPPPHPPHAPGWGGPRW